MPLLLLLQRGSEGLKTLVVSDHGSLLKVKNGVFVVQFKDKRVEVPPAEVDEILISSSGAITVQAIRLALKHGITLFFLDKNGSPWGVLTPSVGTETVKTRVKQYEAHLSSAERYGGEMISAKIYNQAAHVKHWARKGFRVDYKSILDKDEPTAARLYWGELAQVLPRDLNFDGRDPESRDQFNLALNYSYAILYSKAYKYLFLAGLDPYLGFVHRDRPGSPALVFDFSEMFKPLVDFALVRAFLSGLRLQVKDGLISPESRRELAKVVLRAFEERYRELGDHNPKTLDQAMRAHAVKLASAVKDGRAYRGFRVEL
jgi:CRISPR-associated protein Cas1